MMQEENILRSSCISDNSKVYDFINESLQIGKTWVLISSVKWTVLGQLEKKFKNKFYSKIKLKLIKCQKFVIFQVVIHEINNSIVPGS